MSRQDPPTPAGVVILVGVSQLLLVPYQYMVFLSADYWNGRRLSVNDFLQPCLIVPTVLTTVALFVAARRVYPALPAGWALVASTTIAWTVALILSLVGSGVKWYWRANGY